MIPEPRRHLLATNIIVFFFIIVLQKFITIFCFIEEKTCKNKNCSTDKPCGEKNCEGAGNASTESRRQIKKIKKQKRHVDFSLVPTAMRKTMRNFGFGEGHFQMFVEEKQRYEPTMEARLNAADAEKKMNPN